MNMQRKSEESLNTFTNARDNFDDRFQYNNEYNIYNRNKFPTEKDNFGLWKYMSLSKFIALLENGSIYFSKPAAFEDPYEGAFSHIDLQDIIGDYSYWDEEDKQTFWDEEDKQIYYEELNGLRNKQVVESNYVGVSCWHMNEEESAAMWDLYCGRNEGIAIKTSFQDLINSYDRYDYDIYYGIVNYIDYKKDMAGRNSYETLFYKRKSFAHEQEFRMLVFEDEKSLFFGPYGADVKFDLRTLIKSIHISPTSPPWFKDIVQKIVNRYGIEKGVIQSTLYQGPYIIK
ncbi:DUF2971 domain-containing protein [Bacillus sp. D386]|uniref:DUF2971 domain-containing protein n=1 Tax=Bacillus sp. D386 TaxID=2587155 RepID=UPI00111CFC74|nr:DUF2971 domain-containing protein [Bacillus sp. D386]